MRRALTCSLLAFDLGLSVYGRMNLINSTIVGDVQLESGAMQLAGTKAFGDDLQFGPSDVLAIELRSAGAGGHDRLAVQGDAVLGGSLALRARSGFDLAPGETVEIVSIGGEASGQFAGLIEGALVAEYEGLKLFIKYAGGDGNDVAVFARRVGADFNADGVVDGADLQAWEEAWSEDDGGDANADGVAEGRDFLAWQRQYGLGMPASASGSPVPEPGLAAALIALLPWRLSLGRS